MTAKPEPAAPFIRAAPVRLSQLASEMRGWDYEDIRAALIACSEAGWTDEQIYRAVFRLLLLENGDPASLRAEARNPLKRQAADPNNPVGLPRDPEVKNLLRRAVADSDAATAEQRARERMPLRDLSRPGDAA